MGDRHPTKLRKFSDTKGLRSRWLQALQYSLNSSVHLQSELVILWGSAQLVPRERIFAVTTRDSAVSVMENGPVQALECVVVIPT